VSTTAAPTPAPSRLNVASSAARSLPSRAIAFFSGPVGVATKIVLLSISNALAIWAFTVLLGKHSWVAAIVLCAATLAIDAIYLIPNRFVPAKFIVPGTIFLLGFQVIPIIYTVNVAFSKYATGHIGSKHDAIIAIENNSLQPTQNGTTYTIAPARDSAGKLVLVMLNDDTHKPYLGTRTGLKPLPPHSVKTDISGDITSAPGVAIVKGTALAGISEQLSNFNVPIGKGTFIQTQGLTSAAPVQKTLRYDAKTDAFTNLATGTVYRDNGQGAFASPSGAELEPGWRTYIGFKNFSSMIHNPLVRKPFIRVLIWTFVYAALTVLFSFALGLFLAITLDKKGMRFQRLYRSVLVIPYAIPAILSLLVWQGLLNDEFGVVNHLFHIHVPWLFDANWARVSVILVSMWLTFPYFFLVSMGALQSIPAELYEAARVDGGGGWQVFRKVTFPLLLVAVAPLMIASFAFNFNNFNNIYLLTQGGPFPQNASVAGSTDILISYTYKLAFQTGAGRDFGLASASTIIIFFIVAGMSAIMFSRTKALENLA
jgi:arabinogalactan oligomer/maltooligosaccharide transport system permease protein